MRHRTALITTGLIAATVLAGAGVVGANLSILDAADEMSIGELSASTGEALAAGPGELDQGQEPRPVTQEFIADKAGRVDVTADGTGLRLADVSAKRGWRWKLVQTSDKRLTVTFTSRRTTYRFVAKLGADGTIKGRLDEPVTRIVGTSTSPPAARPVSTSSSQVAPAARQTTSQPGYRTDDDADHDDDHDDDESHDDDEHDGGDDDD